MLLSILIETKTYSRKMNINSKVITNLMFPDERKGAW